MPHFGLRDATGSLEKVSFPFLLPFAISKESGWGALSPIAKLEVSAGDPPGLREGSTSNPELASPAALNPLAWRLLAPSGPGGTNSAFSAQGLGQSGSLGTGWPGGAAHLPCSDWPGITGPGPGPVCVALGAMHRIEGN